jgi:hypothetical protein
MKRRTFLAGGVLGFVNFSSAENHLPQGFWPPHCVECGTGFAQHVFSRQPATGASLSGHLQAADRQVRTSLSYLSSILASASSRCSVTTLSLQVEKAARGLAKFRTEKQTENATDACRHRRRSQPQHFPSYVSVQADVARAVT